MISVILLAAGAGRRMGQQENKISLLIGPYTILQWNLLHMKTCPPIDEVIIVTAQGERSDIQAQVQALSLPWTITYTDGGKERQDSVWHGLEAVNPKSEIILVHDGARPLASGALFQRVIDGVKRHGAVVPSIDVFDTIKRIGDDGFVKETLNRSELQAVQTPQGFHHTILRQAHEQARRDHVMGTDDVSLVEHMGQPVMTVEGERENIKMTTPEDLRMGRMYLGVQPMMRIGYGYDVHRFATGRPCILGGVTIDSPIGPDGHSDADVLIHALMDAMLGAAGLRDIGYYFPPEDDAFKGISSRLLLKKVVQLLKDSNFGIYNADIMVIAEAPKLKPHIDRMKENLSQDLDIPSNRISIKATTNEGLGALGRKEGIAAQAVVSIYEREEL